MDETSITAASVSDKRVRASAKTLPFLRSLIGTKITDCIIWPFCRTEDGYGRARFRGKTAIASRVMCELAHGAPPDERYQAAHECGNGRGGCVNPNHLSWKTKLDNMHDMVRHGTLPIGETHGRAVLSDEKALEVRKLAFEGKLLQREIAEKFGISKGHVSSIKIGRRRSISNRPLE